MYHSSAKSSEGHQDYRGGKQFLYCKPKIHEIYDTNATFNVISKKLYRIFLIIFQLHELLNEDVPMDDGEKADHDFDVVSQKGCDYTDSGKGLQIDVEKIIGKTTDGVCIM